LLTNELGFGKHLRVARSARKVEVGLKPHIPGHVGVQRELTKISGKLDRVHRRLSWPEDLFKFFAGGDYLELGRLQEKNVILYKGFFFTSNYVLMMLWSSKTSSS
jgi:hypothetical protein